MINIDGVKRRLESAVGRTPGVSGAVYFGSVAKGTTDPFSDIDLLVRCDAEAAHHVVRALHSKLQIVLYRPFSAGRKPSGRYWFNTTHPFLRLDVSFHEAGAFDELVQVGGEFARPPFLSLAVDDGPGAPTGVQEVPIWPAEDEAFALALRNFQESGKALARGEVPKHTLGAAAEEVHAARPEGLRAEAWELYERSWAELERFGLIRIDVNAAAGSA